MAILITGSTGFIGGYVVRSLLNEGKQVVGVGRRQPSFTDKNYFHIQNDILSVRFPEVIFNHRIDTVIHAASIQPGGNPSFEDLATVNIIATERLLKACSRVKRLIFLSTMSVYGKPHAVPVREDTVITFNRQDYYALSKLAAEKIVDSNRAVDSTFVSLRLASVFGVGHHDGIMHTLLAALGKDEALELYSAGKTLKEAIHVQDVVEVIRRCLSLDRPGSYKMNVGYGELRTLQEIAEFMKMQTGSRSRIVLSPKESPRNYDFFYNLDMMHDLIGYRPVGFFPRLAEYIEEFRASRTPDGEGGADA